jgi:hypothetical protein
VIRRIKITLLAEQIMIAKLLAMVTGKDDQRVLVLSASLEIIDQSA